MVGKEGKQEVQRPENREPGEKTYHVMDTASMYLKFCATGKFANSNIHTIIYRYKVLYTQA